MKPIDLSTPLSFGASFRFPLQSPLARKEVLWGALLLVVLPGWGWLLNMGHRIAYVRNMQQGRPPFPAWTDYRQLTWDGLVTFVGMVWYHAPASVLLALGGWFDSAPLLALGGLLWCAATAVVPGYMTHYCKHGDARAIFNPLLAIRRLRAGGWAYGHAWAIALAALVLSFLGLAGFGVFFFVSSVWFWQVAGFSFATVFSQEFELVDE